ncbi:MULTISPECIES: site-specific integrase [Paraburkholderia]|uniref:Site-specific integrase n=1 Tax=Paraburkholderia madseniana TaxID=2599607 RepID=A0AAP5BPF5_9BURK|nr:MULTISPECIES: site-specific integrase [Paraburkholderia]MCX4151739.1 site-specific integrase [Paraburkholderia madseniana]MDN7154666.1 site-specific integrase [Paraburkholderia sp. WS6]MDQ6413549.1 site-specific integrase [Paraburkholderia madseniana]
MAKSPVIEQHQLRHAVKVASVTGQNAKRDVALLLVFYGTGLTPNEVAKLQVSDYLMPDGRCVVEASLRPEIAFNGKRRPLLWASQKICAAIDDYLQCRLDARHAVTTSLVAFRGLDPNSPLFLTGDGEPFSFTRRTTPAGAVSYSCESLTEIVRRLHQQAGIEHGNASAARRTFVVRLHRDGRSLKLIQQLIGVSSLSAVKRLIDGDPVRLASVVSGVI